MGEVSATYLDANYTGDARQDWCTPRGLFDQLDAEYGFTLDAAASIANHLCARYYTETDNGLLQDWTRDAAGGAVFCNPPWSNAGDWIMKAAHEARKGALVVMLLPVRTSTQAWHRHIFENPNAEVRWIEGRVAYIGAGSSPPMDSAVVVFWPEGWLRDD